MTLGIFVLYSKCSQIKAHCDCLHLSNLSYIGLNTCLYKIIIQSNSIHIILSITIFSTYYNIIDIHDKDRVSPLIIVLLTSMTRIMLHYSALKPHKD